MSPEVEVLTRNGRDFVKPARRRPILFVDVDGVISLFGFPPADVPGSFHQIDGIVHCIGSNAGERLRRLAGRFELVWATGWEEKANEYLPRILALDARELPVVTFDGRVAGGGAHWKLAALDEYAAGRPVAWIDDSLDDRCHAWASERPSPTLLVQTEAPTGITDEHVGLLIAWADRVGGA